MLHATRPALLTALVVLAAASAPRAEDAPRKPEPDRFVVRAKLPAPLAPPAAAAPTTGDAVPAPKGPDAPIVTVTTDESPARVLPATVTVGGDGVVEAVVSAEALGVSGYVEIRPAAGRGLVLAFRDVLRGEVDLGGIAFGDQCPVLAAGRVETAQKKPVAGAAVNVAFQTSAWRTLEFRDLTATTDANGAFTIRADVRDRRGVMFARTERRWQTTVPVSMLKPTKDVRLVAAATTEVRGTIAAPDGLDLEDLVVVVSGAPGALKSAVLKDCSVTYDHDAQLLTFPARSPFVITGLVPGTYDLRLRFRDGTRALAEIPDVVVTESTSELPPIKVDAAVRRARVRVSGPDGSVPAGATVWAREKGDRGRYRALPVGADGAASVAFLSGEVSLAAHAPGTSWAFASSAGEETSLRLEPLPGTPVRVLVPDKAVRGGGEIEVAVTLSWRAGPDVLRGHLTSVRDATDPRETEVVELTFPLQDPPEGLVALPGWYELGFRVRRGRQAMSRKFDCVRIEGPALRTLTLPMTAEQVNEVVRSMGAR